MPLFPRLPPSDPVPLLNSASPWASTEADLEALWGCASTQAVTTRTSTLRGYPDDPSKHQVAFFGSASSLNSFGFSPYPLSQYLAWLRRVVGTDARKKQIIVSIGPADATELAEMLAVLAAFAHELGVTLGVEYNASCPNLNGSPPPAYLPSLLESYLVVFSRFASEELRIGIKLPPYTYEDQISAVVRTIETVSAETTSTEVVSFLTSTNTLGQGLVFASQIVDPPRGARDLVAQTRAKPASEVFAVPTGYGGLAGEAIHQISLGNVHRLRTLLDGSTDKRVRAITVIGVGGCGDAQAVERFRRAGADAVGVATALGREGVDVFAQMRRNETAAT
ncbi:hypothetical protein JCM11491_001542 [Sporobolomyces phaffii]